MIGLRWCLRFFERSFVVEWLHRKLGPFVALQKSRLAAVLTSVEDRRYLPISVSFLYLAGSQWCRWKWFSLEILSDIVWTGVLIPPFLPRHLGPNWPRSISCHHIWSVVREGTLPGLLVYVMAVVCRGD